MSALDDSRKPLAIFLHISSTVTVFVIAIAITAIMVAMMKKIIIMMPMMPAAATSSSSWSSMVASP